MIHVKKTGQKQAAEKCKTMKEYKRKHIQMLREALSKEASEERMIKIRHSSNMMADIKIEIKCK
jgi:hypothetical protein